MIYNENMIFIPYPASKSELKKEEKWLRANGLRLLTSFVAIDVVTVFLVSLGYIVFVQELNTKSLLEFLGLFVYFQSIFLLPVVAFSLLVVLLCESRKIRR